MMKTFYFQKLVTIASRMLDIWYYFLGIILELFSIDFVLGKFFGFQFVLCKLFGFGTIEVAEAHAFKTAPVTLSVGRTLP